MAIRQATLGGGCFWCLEAAFLRMKGVVAVESGYAGGHTDHPDYEAVCSGKTGHAEVVRITFDSDEVSYGELLQVFFALHDPTTPNRQGHDVGTQYRSIILVHDEEQAVTAMQMMDQIAGEFPLPLVTEVQALVRFWPAEAHHARYYDRHVLQPYCQVVIDPKLIRLRSRFPALCKEGGD